MNASKTGRSVHVPYNTLFTSPLYYYTIFDEHYVVLEFGLEGHRRVSLSKRPGRVGNVETRP